MLSKDFMVDYDEAGSIGKRYRRQDEIGTPLCVTVDFQTVGDPEKGEPADDCVTIRDRDTMEQVRLPSAAEGLHRRESGVLSPRPRGAGENPYPLTSFAHRGFRGWSTQPGRSRRLKISERPLRRDLLACGANRPTPCPLPCANNA